MKRILSAVLLLLLSSVLSSAQGGTYTPNKQARDKYQKAQRAIDRRDAAGAEKQLREAIAADPEWVAARLDLGVFLSSLKRSHDAAVELAKAKEMDDSRHQLSTEERRQVVDGLGIAYAMDGQLDKAQAIYESELRKDPDYALYLYNYACVLSERGDLEGALRQLNSAWEHRDTLPRSQQFPDPRKDDSFRRWWDDRRFKQAVENMVI